MGRFIFYNVLELNVYKLYPIRNIQGDALYQFSLTIFQRVHFSMVQVYQSPQMEYPQQNVTKMLFYSELPYCHYVSNIQYQK